MKEIAERLGKAADLLEEAIEDLEKEEIPELIILEKLQFVREQIEDVEDSLSDTE